MASRPTYRLPDCIREILDQSGLPWSYEFDKRKAVKIYINGRPAGSFPAAVVPNNSTNRVGCSAARRIIRSLAP